MNYSKIGPTCPDKVSGKQVKYRTGDCLSIHCHDGRYLGVFISEKFNKYYDFTFIEYLDTKEPTIGDFIEGRFFGNYREEEDRVIPLVHKNMMLCLKVDNYNEIEKVGSMELIQPLPMSSYGYDQDINELLQYYLDDLPQRQINTLNFDRIPDKIFISKRLIEIKRILNGQQPLTL
jgi:hypothetical protein